MFRTSKCSSSGRIYTQFCGISFMHPYKHSGRWQDVFDTYWHRPYCLYGCMKEIPRNCMYNSSWRWTLGCSKHVEDTVIFRIFSNPIHTSFCRFLKRKKNVSSRFQSAPFLQPPLAYKADWLNNIGCYQCFNLNPLRKQCFGRIRRWHSMGGRWWR